MLRPVPIRHVVTPTDRLNARGELNSKESHAAAIEQRKRSPTHGPLSLIHAFVPSAPRITFRDPTSPWALVARYTECEQYGVDRCWLLPLHPFE